MDIEWRCVPFDKLTPTELYNIMKLRSRIFVVEQNCVFLDADDKDQYSYHLSGWNGNILIAYARLLPPASAFNQMSIGRVVSAPEYRNTGIGRKLMQRAIEMCCQLFGKGQIKIGAQLYLKRFYGSFGFIQTGEIYLEDGIEHINMIFN